MILDIQNCGGIRLVPYGESSSTTYWWGDETHTFSCGGLTSDALIRESHNQQWYNGFSPRVMLPGKRDATKPVLNFGGMVYLDGIKILDDASPGDTFLTGGYLGTKKIEVSFQSSGVVEDAPYFDHVYFDVLGIHPAAYSGGVKISGLNSPPNAISGAPSPHPQPGVTPIEGASFFGYYEWGYSTIFRINGRRCYCLNAWARGHSGGRWDSQGRWVVEGIGGTPFCYATFKAGGIIGNGIYVRDNFVYPIYDED